MGVNKQYRGLHKWSEKEVGKFSKKTKIPPGG